MRDSKRSFWSRVDKKALRALWHKDMLKPIDALNLVNVIDEISSQLYGLLLAPILLSLGCRPVWVGVHQRSIYGDKRADEIAIVRYPSHRILLFVIATPYYSLVNRLREKGVKNFEFSLTEFHASYQRVKHDGQCLVVHFNDLEGTSWSSVEKIKTILDASSAHLLYASREISNLAIFHDMKSTDPNPAKYKGTAIFSIPSDVEASESLIHDSVVQEIQGTVGEISLQIYQPLSITDIMPWSKRQVIRC